MSVRRIHLAIAVCLFLTTSIFAQTPGRLRFQITLDPALSAAPVSGRLIVFMTNNPVPQEILDAGFQGDNVWLAAREVRDLAPGQSVEVDPDEISSPKPFSQAAAGDYQVMALLDVDHNAANNTFTNPDLRSTVVQIKALNPAQVTPVELKLSEHVQQVAMPSLPADQELIDFVSPALSAFWGRDIHMRGIVVLPAEYSTSKARYPTIYWTHGFGGRLEYFAKKAAGVSKDMAEGTLPPMIWIMLDESCPSGTHEFADSVNNGPWGSALTTELIPFLEHKYRMDAKPKGRFLTGHSSGGWATMWLQVNHPHLFGGTWSTSPDPVDFRDWTNTDLTRDNSVYTRPDGTPTRLIRMDGKDVMSFERYSHQEAVLGEYGGQLSSFDWVFSPRGADGRPLPMFDRHTGTIHHDVAQYWLDHYDIAHILTGNARQLAPQLKGKIHIVVGTTDTFYLDGAVHLLQKAIEPLGYNPKITFLDGRTHFDLYKGGLESRIAQQMYDIARPKQGWKPKVAPDQATELAK